MSETDSNAVATLTLAVNTSKAVEDLQALGKACDGVEQAFAKLGGKDAGPAMQGIQKGAEQGARAVKEMTDSSKKSLSDLGRQADETSRKLQLKYSISGPEGKVSLANVLTSEQEREIVSRYHKMGQESISALMDGQTRSALQYKNKIGDLLERDTQTSLSSIHRLLNEASKLEATSPTTALAKYGESLLGGQGDALRAQVETRSRYLAQQNELRAEEAAKDRAYLADAKARIAEWRKLNNLNESGYAAQELRKNLAERDKLKAEEAAKDRAYLADAKARIKEWKKLQADEAAWAVASPKARAQATLNAAQLFYDGKNTAQLSGLAGSSQALQAAQSAGSVKAAEEALKKLNNTHTAGVEAIRNNAAAQMHWNNVANEAHAAARGLSGALGGLWMTYGSIAPLVAAAAVAGSMKSMVSTGMELEYQFSVVKAVSGGATVSVEEFNRALQGSMFSPVEAARGLRVLAQAGLSVKESQEALPAVLKLATMGEVDLADAALSATSIMHTFGKSVDDVQHIGDVFSLAAAKSATSVKEMMAAMRQASSVSDMYGVSVEETAAALGTLANRGIEGSAAGTAVRNMVKELSAPATKRAADAMKQMGIEIYNADGSIKPFMENMRQLEAVTKHMSAQAKNRFLEDLFNERGVKAANILLTDMGKMKKLLDETQKSSEGLGFMTEGSITISQSATGMLKQLGAALQVSYADVFKSVEPEVKRVIAALTDLVQSTGFKEWLSTIASSMVSLTSLIREHASAIGYTVAAYAGLKIGVPLILGLSSAWKQGAAAVAIYNAALDVGPMQAGLAGVTARLNAATIATGQVAAQATTTTGAFGRAAAAATAFGAALPVAAVVALTASIGYLILAENEHQKKMRESADAATAAAESSERLAASTRKGVDDLIAGNKITQERIRLLMEQKGAADAAAQAEINVGRSTLLANLEKARAEQARVLEEHRADPNKDVKPSLTGALLPVVSLVQSGRSLASTYRYSEDLDRANKAMSLSLKALEDYDKATSTAMSESKVAKELGATKKRLDSVLDLNTALAETTKNLPKLRKELADTLDAPVAKGGDDARKNKIYMLKKSIEHAERVSKLKSLDSLTATDTDIKLRSEQLREPLYDYKKQERPSPATGALISAEKTEIMDAYRFAEKMANQRYSLESELADKRFKEGLDSEQEYETARLAINKKYLEEVKAAEAAARDAIASTSTRAEIPAQLKQLENARKSIEDKIKEQEQAHKLSMEKARREVGMTSEILVKTVRTKEIPSLESKAKVDRNKADAELQKDLLLNEDKVALAARVQEESRYADAIAKVDAQLAEEIRLNGENTERVNLLRQAKDALSASLANEVRVSQEAAAAREKERMSFEYGVKKGLVSYINEVDNIASLSESIMNKSFKGMEDALVEFVTTGKLSFKSLVDSILATMARITIRENITGPLARWMKGSSSGGGSFGWLGSLFGGGSSSVSDIAGSAMSTAMFNEGMFFAKGGVVPSRSISAYSNQIVDKPTPFQLFAKGSPAIMGEEGPEAIIPLMRDKDGKLGIKSQGEASKAVNINVHMHGQQSAPDARRAAGQGAREAWAALQSAQRYS